MFGMQDLKLKFYQLMIELDEHEGLYLAIAKHYRAIYDTPQVKENKDKTREVGSLQHFTVEDKLKPVSFVSCS